MARDSVPISVRVRFEDVWAEGYAQGRDDEARDEPLRQEPVRRVVLVKPGDVLLIGNVGEIPGYFSPRALRELINSLGIQVVIFAGDIDMAAVSSDGNQGG